MQRLKRKLWWWFITIPLKVNTFFLPLLPKRERETLSYTDPVIKLHQLSEYVSYQFLSYRVKSELKVDPIWKAAFQDSNYFNPIDVAVDALVFHNNKQSKSSFLRHFEDNYTFLKNYAVWDNANSAFWIPYYLDYPKYGMKAPWVSGLTQALTLSVALRMKPQDHHFIDGLYTSLSVPVKKGGVKTQHPSGYPWIAEYPGDIPFVLNGQLSVLIGLAEYYNYSGKENAYELFLQIFKGILQDYNEYVLKNELRYCWKTNQLANIQYKGLHAFQLLHLYKLTQLQEIRRLALEWINVVSWKDFCRFHHISKEGQVRLIHRLRQALKA
jgi:hypothetical protein